MISNSRIKSSTNGQLYAALDLGSNSFHMLVGRFDDSTRIS